jgi:type I restriction-modification system DNA methylase subunit
MPMISQERIAAIQSFEDLATFCYEELGWPLATWKTFDGVPALYGIQPADIPDVQRLAAVQPLDASQPWGIFEVDFGDKALKHSDLRRILNKVAERARAQHPNPTWPHDKILFICRSETNSWTFAYFTGDKLANAKLRRFGWSNPSEARTAIENLRKLRWGADWAEAWNVEKLTEDFFSKLSELFYDAMEAIAKAIPDESERRLFIQTLFNRLIFLRFVEKKGWLKFNGRDDYLRALWEAGQDGMNPFWPTRLNALFQAVNHKESDEAHIIAKPLIGDVVYLNGGLFEDDPRFVDPNIKIPEKIFEKLLGPEGLFYRYNFTVEESTPLDQQVAVDPEILGKIFEQLTISSKRHDTGSYYTPREIVQFMCREALVGYLGSKGLSEDKARKLVYEHDDSELSNQEGNLAFEALKAIKVVDPACGSGAYLLGMLQELYALFELLRREDRKFSGDPARESHERKLWIIENNLYGVDIQEFATNTAMLRLWLTLLVEDSGEKPQPLPNLEYKIETGDSLLGPDPSQPIDWSKVQRGLDFEGVHETVEELRKLREKYQNAHGKDKTDVKAQLEAKLAELREKVTGSPEKDPAEFDWRVEFFDVFLEDPKERQPGFDAVLANPPYVRQELITHLKPALRRVYGDLYSGTADLYCYFYFRGVQLLKPGGMFVFISSNKWFRAAYGKKLREFMAKETAIRSITDFGELPVFTAATFPMIFVAQKRSTAVPAAGDSDARDAHATVFTQVKSLDPPYPDVAALIAESGFALPPGALNGAEWRLVDAETAARMRRMEASGIPLGEYVKGKIYYGIKTGFNEAFVIDGKKRAELIAEDPKSAEIIKPLAVGDDVRRWHIRRRDRWLIFTRRGVDIDRYPAIKRHLSQWRKELEPRPRDWKPSRPGEEWPGRASGDYAWYELQASPAEFDRFEGPKIVYPVIGKEPRFAFDVEGSFTNDKAFIIPSESQFLAGVLNSKAAWFWMKNTCSAVGADEEKGRLELRSIYMVCFPVPRASDADRDAIAALVQKCIDARIADPDADVSQYEAEIDARVEFLYFHQDEAPTYDAWLAKREAERGTVVEEIRNLAAGGENSRVEFKETLEAGGTTPEHKAAVFTASLRAICSFINKEGGTLLIGVNDDGEIVGLERDGASDPKGRDQFQQKIANALRSRCTNYSPNLIDIVFAEVDGKWVAKVEVKPTRGAKVLLDGKLYVRDLTTTHELDPGTMAYLANVEMDDA